MSRPIAVENVEKVKNLLNNVQKKCRTRIYDDQGVKGLRDIAEDRLDSLDIPQKLRSGATYTIGHESFANSYSYVPYGTIISIYRGSKKWYIDSVERTICNRPGRNGLTLPEKTREYLKKRIDSLYT